MAYLHNSDLFPFDPAFEVAAFLDRVDSPRLTDTPAIVGWITEAAREYDLNPRWLLALAQKEQSLITRPRGTFAGGSSWDHACKWAMGYGYTEGPVYSKYAGTERQIFSAAAGIRGYLTPGRSFYVGGDVGVAQKWYDGAVYAPANLAEAAALKYTPRMSALKLHTSIQREWFGLPQEEQNVNGTREAVVDVARRVVAARKAGNQYVAINKTRFNTLEKGWCARFVRQVHEAACNLADGIMTSSHGGPHACCASATEVNLRGSGYKVASAVPGAIVCFNNPASGGKCSTCGRAVGHIGIYLGDGLVAENTSSAKRGDPRAAGTKITKLSDIGASRVSGYYAVLPAAAGAAPGYVEGPVKCMVAVPDDTQPDGLRYVALRGILDDGTTYVEQREYTAMLRPDLTLVNKLPEEGKTYVFLPGEKEAVTSGATE